MNYWIFQSVVTRYDLRVSLQENTEETWLVSRYWQQMLPGDLVFFWLGGSPDIRGIYGWGALASAPKMDSDKVFEVNVRCDKRLSAHLSAARIRTVRKLKNLSVLRAPVGTNFIVTREEAQAISEFLDLDQKPLIPPLPAELVEFIRSRESVLFAGAGLSARAGTPTWDEFLNSLLVFALEREIIDGLEGDQLKVALNQGARNEAADGLLHAFGSRRGLLEEFLKNTFPPGQALSSAHSLLANIPFSAVVTTNYDDLLERTFPSFATPGLKTPKDADALLDVLSQRLPFILKLYGVIERPDSLILSPIEYQEAVSSNVSFSKFVEGLFFSRSFFFVGLSLEGIEDFLSGFVFRGALTRKHFALVAVSGTAWKTKASFLERRFNVRIIDYPVSETFPEFEKFIGALEKATAPSVAPASHQEAKVPIEGIRKIVLEDIGSFERLELDFDKHGWKILLGDNGVGKSTILKAIAVAIIGSDARAYAGRLVRAGKTRGRITVFTERNHHGYITDILTKDMLSDSEVMSIPSRCMEAEGWLALGFSPLRSVTWTPSSGPQPIGQKGRPTADDLIPLLSGESDPRIDRLKQWIVNLDAASKQNTNTSDRERGIINRVFEVIVGLTDRKDLEFLTVTQDFHVMVKLVEAPTGIPLELMSQGLTSLLGWVGYLCQRLKETSQDQNRDLLPTNGYALVLVDELDAHMHPRWQQVLVRRLKEIFPNVQFIASTHSPLIVAGLEASEVVRFERDASGVIQITRPEHGLKGMGAAGLLTSELFGLSSHLDSETADALDRKRQLTAKRLQKTLTANERLSIDAEIEELDEQVKDVDATKFVRDPLYPKFVEAMSSVELELSSQSNSVALTSDEKKKKSELAQRIVRDLMQKEEEKKQRSIDKPTI